MSRTIEQPCVLVPSSAAKHNISIREGFKELKDFFEICKLLFSACNYFDEDTLHMYIYSIGASCHIHAENDGKYTSALVGNAVVERRTLRLFRSDGKNDETRTRTTRVYKTRDGV